MAAGGQTGKGDGIGAGAVAGDWPSKGDGVRADTALVGHAVVGGSGRGRVPTGRQRVASTREAAQA
jgi:hypothetical protein